jgi:hypothetical protein
MRTEDLSRNKTLSRKDHEGLTDDIRKGRLQKGQKKDQGRPVSQGIPPVPQGQGQQRYSQGPPQQRPPNPRATSTNYPPPNDGRPVNPRHSSYGSQGYPPADQPDQRRYSSPNQPPPQGQSYSPTMRPAGATGGQPSLATLANLPPDGYKYSPPTRPASGPTSRPGSQGSLGGTSYPPPTAPVGRPQDVYGSGPKTFAEMGVSTSQKKDTDCLIM